MTQYQDAKVYFANLDVLIGSIMAYQHWDMLDIPSILGPKYERINLFYSTPEYYTKMKYKQTVRARRRANHPAVQEQGPLPNNLDWKVKTDDFFPYADGAHNFWTGYFTSRTAFKRFERVASGFLLAARQIEAHFSNVQANHSRGGPLFALEDALGVG